MKSVPAVTHSVRVMVILLASVVLCHLLARTAYAQYGDDLKDVNTSFYWKLRHLPVINVNASTLPSPIGNLGNIERVVDLRGFVPMSLASKAAFWRMTLVDALAWYKIPTKKALLMLYFGSLVVEDIATDTTKLERQFDRTAFLEESSVNGEDAQWCNLSYDLAKNSAPLFQRIAGGGFESAEPTTIFMTDRTTFVILSFKYRSSLVSRGQVLIALEFSRSSKSYKTFYPLYSTVLLSKPRAEAAKAIAPFVAKTLVQIYGGQ